MCGRRRIFRQVITLPLARATGILVARALCNLAFASCRAAALVRDRLRGDRQRLSNLSVFPEHRNRQRVKARLNAPVTGVKMNNR